MKKIVDINYLRSPNLENYLSKSQDNFVVFTDFACMECLKCNVHKNLKYNLSIVSRYPKQVIILKGTRKIISATLDSDNIPQCLIDVEQTLEFSGFCRQVMSGSNPFLSNDLLFRQKMASEYIENLKNGHELIVEGIKGFVKSHNPSHIKSLRKGERLPEVFIEDVTRNIIYATKLLFEKHPDVQFVPDKNHFIASYVFRYTASAYFLALKWVKDGGIESTPKEKLRNDHIDMSYVTYATYFDGLMSIDKKMIDIYNCLIPYLDWANKCQAGVCQ